MRLCPIFADPVTYVIPMVIVVCHPLGTDDDDDEALLRP